MAKWFSIVLLSLGLLWAILFAANPNGWQRDIVSRDTASYFTDFLLPRQCLDLSNRYNVNGKSVGYPFVAVEMLRPFSCDRTGAVLHMAVSGLLFLAALWYFAGLCGMPRRTRACVLAGLSMSWIFVRTVERGNTIFWTAALVCLFFAWFDSKTLWKRITAAVCLGLATALKISPAYLGVLYFLEPLRDERGQRRFDWPSMILSGAVAAGLFFVPFFVADNGIASIQAWLAVVNREALGHPSSWGLYGSCGILNLIVHRGAVPLGEIVPPLQLWHCKAATFIAGLLPFFASLWFSFGERRNRATRSDRMFFTVATLLVWSMNSAFYVGLLLFPALILWLQEIDSDRTADCRSNVLELLLWILMLMPVQIIATGKPMSLTITFVTFWAIIILRTVRCFGRNQNCNTFSFT